MTTTASTVTVLICVRDGADYIAEAIASALNQTAPPFEVLVIDDGSTDDSAAVAGTAGARVLRQGRLGLGAARNAGFQQARSDFVFVLDADDRLTTNALRALAAALDANPLAAAAAGLMRQFVSPEILLAEPSISIPTTDLQPCILVSGAIWRRSIAASISFDTEEAACDPDWITRAREQGHDVIRLDDLVLERRVHRTNTTLRIQYKSSLIRVARAAVVRRRNTVPR